MSFPRNPHVLHPPKTILVCEDLLKNQIDIARALWRLFPSEAEIGVTFVQDGAGAAAWLEKNRADLVILDHDMPTGTGSEFLRWLIEKRVETRVMTASGIPANNDLMASIYPVLKFSKDDIVKGRADLTILKVLGYPEKSPKISIAVVWGEHRNDAPFHTHHAFWEAAIREHPLCEMTRYTWPELGEIPKTHDLYFFVDWNPRMYFLPKYEFKNTAFFAWDTHHISQALVFQSLDCVERAYFAERLPTVAAREYGFEVTWLPAAYYQGIYGPIAGRGKVHHYSFIGQQDNNVWRKGDTKRSFIEKLAHASGLHGYVGTGIYGSEVNGIYNDAEILFERTIFSSIGTRFFELLGSGGFVLMNRLRPWSGIEHVAVDGLHYASYDDSYEDFEKKFRYYLDRPEDRRRIAEAGHAHVRENHTYARRLEKILTDFDLLP